MHGNGLAKLSESMLVQEWTRLHSVQGVPSQGTLDSRMTCGTSGPPEQGGPAHTRQLAAMPNPASRRERRKAAAASKAASNKPPQTSGGTTEGSTAALSIPPQDSGQTGGTATLTGTATTGGAEADDRMDVAQSSSSSEAETSEEETVDEDTLLRSPLEQEIETGTAPSCSAEASTGGEKLRVVLRPLRQFARKNASVGTHLVLLLNKQKNKICLVLSLSKDNHIKYLHGPRSTGSEVRYLPPCWKKPEQGVMHRCLRNPVFGITGFTCLAQIMNPMRGLRTP